MISIREKWKVMTIKYWKLIATLSTYIFVANIHAETTELLFVTEHTPPYQYYNKSEEVDGFTTKIIHEALKLTPYKYQIKIFPWSRSFNMAKAKKNTCIFLMSKTEEREPYFHWVSPLVLTNDYFVGLSTRTDIRVESIDEVKKYNVAVLKEDRTYYELIKHGFVERENLYVINNSSSMLNLLMLRKEIDFVLSDTVTIKYRALFNDIDPSLFTVYLKLNKEPTILYLACNLQTPNEVIETLGNAIETIKENGTYDKLLNAWQ